MNPNTFSSYSDASVMKNKYQNIRTIPARNNDFD
jgi:hypothetical protein